MSLAAIFDFRVDGREAALPRRAEVRARPRATLNSARPGGRSGADRSCQPGRLNVIASPPAPVLAKDSQNENCVTDGLKPKSCARHPAKLIRSSNDDPVAPYQVHAQFWVTQTYVSVDKLWRLKSV